jgi:GT2 family glycosyltransferase
VILTHGQGAEASRLARELIEQEVDAESIVVVHNPIGDRRLELDVEGPRVVRLPENRGYPGGMNAGARYQLERRVARVLFLTHDVALRPGAVATLLATADRKPEYGILGPALMRPGTDVPFSFGTKALPGGGLAHRLRRPPVQDGVADASSVDGAVMLLRTDALRAAGLFDERFFIYWEEADLCLRVARAGFRVGVAIDAVAEQESGVSKRPGAFGYLMGRNGLEYARRAAGPSGVALTLVRYLADTFITLFPWLRSVGREPLAEIERARLIGLWIGAVAFAMRRWGPPPPFLAGLGDLHES